MNRYVRIAIVLAASALAAACSGPAAPTVAPDDIQATVDAVLTASAPAVTEAPSEPTAASGLSFEAVTYTDSAAGFQFEYPSGWAVGPVEQQSRGAITAFTSWDRPTDVLPNETPPGGTRLDVVVQLWDPKGDLEAFVAQRKAAWEASGVAVTPQEEWTLTDDRLAESFLLQGSDGKESYFFVTTLDDKYLVLSGEGDLALLAEVAHTVRLIPLYY